MNVEEKLEERMSLYYFNREFATEAVIPDN